MPLTPAIPGQPQEDYAKRRLLRMVKAGTACLFVLLLMYVGFKGKQHAGGQARLNDLALLRDQLQQKLDDDQLVGCVSGPRTNATWSPSSDPPVAALVSALKARLWQFDADYSQARLAEVDQFELRLTEATLANAEGRFADGLAMVAGKDPNTTRSTSEVQTNRLVRVLDIRADSFYGLRQWQNALDHYRQLLIPQPNRLVALSRAAECEYALGKTNEALSTCAELAKSHKHRANALRIQGKAYAAIAHYGKAIQIQTWLVEQQGRKELLSDLAKTYKDRGETFMIQRNPDAANADFEKAKEYELRSP